MSPVVAEGIGHERGGSVILDGIDMHLEAGALTALVGPNGAGKSTLIRILAGDTRPTRGSVLVEGRPITDFKPAHLALIRAVLPQQIRLEFAFTVRQVVELGRYAHARGRWTSSRDDAEAIVTALAETGVTSMTHLLFPTLSVGEQALVMIARVLAQQTPVLFLDEPTAFLDIRHQHRVMGVIRRRARRGTAVLAAVHDLNLAARYADRIGVVEAGRLRALGTPEEVLRSALLSEVYRYPIEVLDHPNGAGRLVAATEIGDERTHAETPNKGAS